MHRIGRTGRAGRQGDAVLFMTPRERFLLKQIERTTRQQVEEMAVPSVADVNAARKRRFADGITRTLERASEEELAVFGEIVAAYVDEHEVEPARVAAALGMMTQGGRPLLAREQEIPFGGARGRTDVPKIVDWYMDGKINIDDLITHHLPLDRINEGFDLMKSGESIRSVVLY